MTDFIHPTVLRHPDTGAEVVLPVNLGLAPMAGVTMHAMRRLSREGGAGMVISEMVLAKALIQRNDKTMRLARLHPDEIAADGGHPTAIQIAGNDPDTLAEAVRICEELGAAYVNLNLGCPARKIMRGQYGCDLMRRPGQVAELVRAMVRAATRPVTVKTRTGVSDDNLNAPEIARICQEEGASWVCVHGRTAEQKYRGHASLENIARVVEAVDIPVWGNGDVTTPESAERMFRETGCDGILIGRGAYGRPHLFAGIIARLEGRPEPAAPEGRDLADLLMRHYDLLEADQGEWLACRVMRRHATWYLKGREGAPAFRQECNHIESREELAALVDRFFAGEPAPQGA